jgi:uncharacterized repeat protein (TIGR04138 family)
MAQPEQGPEKSLEELEAVVKEIGLYPVEAYLFVQQGLSYTVQKLHANKPKGADRHVSGQQLSAGLRDFALRQWGMLAGTVLRRWNITRTDDFGRIVYALVENGFMSKTDEDSIDDFKNVFDFREAFDDSYRIERKS